MSFRPEIVSGVQKTVLRVVIFVPMKDFKIHINFTLLSSKHGGFTLKTAISQTFCRFKLPIDIVFVRTGILRRFVT